MKSDDTIRSAFFAPRSTLHASRASPSSVVRRLASGIRIPVSAVCRPSSGVCSKGGSALIVVLWVIGILSMFVMVFAFDMHVEARITSSWRKKLKAEYLAKGGVELARMMLLETADPDTLNTDPTLYLSKGSDEKVRGATISLARGGVGEVTRELGAGTMTVTVRPENALISLKDIIDVNNPVATRAMWEPLFEAVGVPWEERDMLIDCLLDWVDPDELTHLSGAESEYYESLDPPYKAKNAALDTVDELALIKGFNEKLSQSDVTMYQKLSEYLTTYATDSKININAVDRNTLMGVLYMDAALADEIIAQRQGPDLKDGTDDDMPFKTLQDLQGRVPGLPPTLLERLTVSAAGRYTILVCGKVGDIEHAIACVVELKEAKNLTILRWIEGDALQANLLSH